MRLFLKVIIKVVLPMLVLPLLPAQTWTADNGNGTFTNPLFYDEFSDPDMIRVGTARMGDGNPERFWKTVDSINTAAGKLYQSYDQSIRTGRATLAL